MFKALVVESDQGVYFTLQPHEISNVKRAAFVNTNLTQISQLAKPAPIHLARGFGPIVSDSVDHWASFNELVRLLKLSDTSIEYRFLKEKTYREEGVKIDLESLWQQYKTFAYQNNARPMEKKTFGKYLTNSVGLERRQTTHKGRNITCVFGVVSVDDVVHNQQYNT